MTPPIRRSRTRVSAWVVVALAGAVAGAAVLGAWHPWSSRTPAPVAVAAGSGDTVVIEPEPLSIPDDARVLVFGDSWTYGSAATLPTEGYAYVLGAVTGWTTIVEGVRGSGYLKPGIDGPDFGTRIAALDPDLDPDVVIVQGSINDRKQGAAGYRDAVTAAWDALASLYPGATIVVLGPAPQVLPVETATARIDADLHALAAARGWWYISPIEEEWITDADYLDVIDTSAIGNNHPSSAGHAYLAERLAEALAARSEATEVALPAESDAQE